jgi:glutamate N-acetyltransferase/amino-acid N-acetyltransferase
LTVDGDTSTNDMVALLASGASLVKPLGKNRERVAHAVRAVLESLAEQIAADGEGATRLVVIEAVGFSTNEDARKVARAIANSPLVKTAVAGCDPNWGRVLAAAGYSGVSFDPTRIDIDMQGVPVCRGGLAVELNEDSLKRRLDEHRVDIRVELRRGGKGQARFYTCDLTEGYIRINGSYRT